MTLTVAVFSFKRGDYLQNCLASIARNLPDVTLRIYDDGSDDAETLKVLHMYEDYLGFGRGGLRSKHGGLYGNMQTALDECETDYLLFLQDDMQIVRAVSPADIAVIDMLFLDDPLRAFICPVFLKDSQRVDFDRLLTLRADGLAFGLPDDADPLARAARYCYGDVSIIHVGRARAAGWRFQNREQLSMIAARKTFSDMPYLAVPFAAFCPEVPVFRQRKVTLAARLAARLTGSDVKAFHDMAVADVARLRGAGPQNWPIADAYLTPVNPAVRRPFVYQNVKVRAWLALMHRIELAFKKR